MRQRNGFTGHETATKVTETRDVLTVRYHQTTVVQYNSRTRIVTLSTGGWRTVTTKHRMNQAAEHLGHPWRVRSENGNWFVEMGEEILPFDTDILEFSIDPEAA